MAEDVGLEGTSIITEEVVTEEPTIFHRQEEVVANDESDAHQDNEEEIEEADEPLDSYHADCLENEEAIDDIHLAVIGTELEETPDTITQLMWADGMGWQEKKKGLPDEISGHLLSTLPVTCRFSCPLCTKMCGRQPDLSQILDWKVVSGEKSLTTILTDPSVIDNVIRLRLHLDHPDTFTYVGYSQPTEPAFRPDQDVDIPNCMTTFTHFVESNQVVCVVIEMKQRFISCAKWYYSNRPRPKMHDDPLKQFLRTSLAQVLGRSIAPVISFTGDATKWRCKTEHTTVDGLCAAFMLCADFLLDRSWEKRIFTMSGEANTRTFLEKAYNILAVIMLKEKNPGNPLDGPVSPLLRERVFVGKLPLEMPLTCQLCLDDIDLCCSWVFFHAHVTPHLSRQMHCTFPVSFLSS
jgi:hypothetical protein